MDGRTQHIIQDQNPEGGRSWSTKFCSTGKKVSFEMERFVRLTILYSSGLQ